MNTNRTPVQRALALASRRGVKTQARTLTGILKALRKAPSSTPTPARRFSPSPMTKRGDIPALRAGFDQGRAKTRLINQFAPLAAVVSAALGQDVYANIPHVPHSYRGKAEASYAVAGRFGQAVVYAYGRTTCGHAPYGSGSTVLGATPGYGYALRAAEVRAILPRLPAGYRWSADKYGVRIVRLSDQADYHPQVTELADIIRFRKHETYLVRAIDNLERNAATREATRIAAEREAADLEAATKDLWICRADSLKAGNCAVGTDHYINDHHLDPHRHYRAAALLRADPVNSRLRLVINAARERAAREAGNGVCLLADH